MKDGKSKAKKRRVERNGKSAREEFAAGGFVAQTGLWNIDKKENDRKQMSIA